jgi:murein DD-endopeptidase MepM/ murein hydrolase activator NlpD
MQRSRTVSLCCVILAIALVLGACTANPEPRVFSVSPPPTLVTPNWTPPAPFARLDPAIIAYLQYGPQVFGVQPLEVLGADVLPVGAYIASADFVLTDTPQPTNTFTPTATASHTPTATFTATSTLTPTLTPEPTPTPITFTPAPTETPWPTLPPSDTPTSTQTPRPSATPTETATPSATFTSTPTLTLTPTNELVATVLAFVATAGTGSAPSIVGSADCAPEGYPIDGILTQRFHDGHPGIDLAAPQGMPVYATQSGEVIFAGWSEIGYGNLVAIKSGRFITYYGHNAGFNVQEGDKISRGMVIAYVGSTGNSSGPHVHYETRMDDVPVDPLTFQWRGHPVC